MSWIEFKCPWCGNGFDHDDLPAEEGTYRAACDSCHRAVVFDAFISVGYQVDIPDAMTECAKRCPSWTWIDECCQFERVGDALEGCPMGHGRKAE